MMNNKVDEIIDHDEYEVPKDISRTEAFIYDWVVNNFGESEAEEPSWNIHALAQAIDEADLKNYQQQYTIKYRF